MIFHDTRGGQVRDGGRFGSLPDGRLRVRRREIGRGEDGVAKFGDGVDERDNLGA